MKKAKHAWKIWLLVLLLTAITGVAGIPGIILSAVNGIYVLMALCIALVAHAFYGITFYALAMANAGHDARVAGAVEQYGLSDLGQIAAAASLPPETAKQCLERCLRKGYLAGYMLTESGIAPIVNQRPPEPEQPRYCAYCGRKLSPGDRVCPGCGAPVD